jgi:Cu+-exporting ATPase
MLPMEPIKFEIDGMSCGGCAAKITSALQRDPRVVSAVIDFATHSGVVEGEVSRSDVSQIVASLGYHLKDDATARAVPRGEQAVPSLSREVFVAGVIALPVVVLAMGPWTLNHQESWQAVLTTIFMLGPARGFFFRAGRQLRQGFVTMDALVAIGMASAWLTSVIMMAKGHEHLYFESAVMIGFFVLLGKSLEDWARRQSISEVDRLVRLRPRRVYVKRSEPNPIDVSVDDVVMGDVLYVRPGDMVAFDGIVIEGTGGFDESVVTGESAPMIRSAGDRVLSGAINAAATGVLIKVDKVGSQTTIEQIIKLIEDARLSRPSIQKFADRVSAVFVPVVTMIALVVTVTLWLLSVSVSEAIMRGLSVLVVACPCALGLAMPVAWVAGLGRAAKAGVLVRSYEALENLRRASVIIFDKTGTLTIGKPSVTRAYGEPATMTESMVMTLSALSHSSHPLSRALTQWIKAGYDVSKTPSSRLVEDNPGFGFRCEVYAAQNHQVVIGRPDFVAAGNIPISWRDLMRSGRTLVAVSVDGAPQWLFELDDAARPDVKEALARLKSRGITLYMASGDRREVVEHFSNEYPDIKAARGDQTPLDKKNWVESIRTSGQIVAFVGDGINDGPALAAADVGIAVGTGTDLAAHSAGLVLQRPGISSIAEAIDLSQLISRVIWENFFWAFIYNIAAIPAAIAGLMTPMWASAAMALSSLSVVLNALRLKVMR